jgi:hypothetical protein
MELPYLDPAFWSAWPKKSGAEFARFLKAVKRGRPIDTYDGNKSDRQKLDLERSLEFCRKSLGLGLKA